MTVPQLAKLQGEVAALGKRLDLEEQSVAILLANLTLTLGQAKDAIADCRAALVRLGELEKVGKDLAHRQSSFRSALTATMDYLDKVAPIENGGGSA